MRRCDSKLVPYSLREAISIDPTPLNYGGMKRLVPCAYGGFVPEFLDVYSLYNLGIKFPNAIFFNRNIKFPSTDTKSQACWQWFNHVWWRFRIGHFIFRDSIVF